MNIPTNVKQLCARSKTQAHLARSHEFHDLRSLSTRILRSPAETLNIVADGHLLSLDARNGLHLFSSTALDSIRNSTIDFIAQEICHELSVVGADDDRQALAVERAIHAQYNLSRQTPNVIEFDNSDDDDDSFGNGIKQGAGAAIGAGAVGLSGYALYNYLKNRKNGANGQPPQLGNGSGSGPYIDLPPSGGGSGGAGATPQLKAPMSNQAALPNAPASNVAGQDLLSQAAKRGRQALGSNGLKAVAALRRFVP